jgi:hypothetical protein
MHGTRKNGGMSVCGGSLGFAVASVSLPGVSLRQSGMKEVSANYGSDTALINST